MYEKPIIIKSSDTAEGVFMASGGGGSDADCYSAQAHITQTPETGRNNYVIHVDGQHQSDHVSEGQQLELIFNLPVKYVSSQGKLVSGDGTNDIIIEYHYHNNPTDNIGLGDVVVEADAGLIDPEAIVHDIDKRY